MNHIFVIEQIEEITAPLSNDFWTGAAAGFGAVVATAGLYVGIAALVT